MYLKLLADESLDSFCSRNFVYGQNWRNTDFFRKLGFDQKWRWSKKKIVALAVELGLRPKFGFNYLLHYHTNYFRSAFFVRDIKCSPYGASGSLLMESAGSLIVKICPACIDEAYSRLGFIYWKRNHQSFDIDVCSRHNLRLVNRCSGCYKVFTLARHFWEAPWSSCDCGYSVLDSVSEKNQDDAALSLSKFVDDLYGCQYQLEVDDVKFLVRSKLKALGFSNKAEIYLEYRKTMSELQARVLAENAYASLIGGKVYVWGLPYVLAALFVDFNDFASAASEADVSSRNLYTAWDSSFVFAAEEPKAASFYTSRKGFCNYTPIQEPL